MSDKRIIQLTETQTIADDDYVPVDGATGGTKKFLASNLGGKAEVMTETEWDDLPDSKLSDGKVYALSGVSPSTQDNPLWQKLGFAALDTEADDCSDAINELNTGLTTLNSNIINLTPIQRGKKTDVSLTAGTYTEVQIDLPTAYASKNDYVVFVSIIAYVDPINLYYAVRSKESTHFVLRIRNNYSSAFSVSIDWMTMHV